MYALAPTSTSLSFTLTLTTMNGSTEVGTDVVTRTGSFTATNPTYDGTFTYSPSPLIVGYTAVEFFLSKAAQGTKSATISQYKVTVNGVNKTSASYTGPFLFTPCGGSSATLTITDSRNKTYTQTITLTTDGTDGVALDVDTATNRVAVGKYISNEAARSLSVAGDIYEGGQTLSSKYAVTYSTSSIQSIAQQAMLDLMEASY